MNVNPIIFIANSLNMEKYQIRAKIINLPLF